MILWVAGCVSPDPRPEVVAALATDEAHRYDAFASAAEELERASRVLCAAPDEASLAAVRDAWWEARAPWRRATVVGFGPVTELPERLGPKLDTWPVDEDAVETLVASDAPASAEDVRAMGVWTRGLPVVEWRAWAGDPVVDPRRCEVLVGETGAVRADAADLAAAWRDGFVERVPFEDPQDGVDAWVNRMAFTVADLRGLRLGRPVGDEDGGTPHPELVESRASGRSLADARDVLEGVRETWAGASGPGIRVLVGDPVLAERVDTLLAGCAERLAIVPEPLERTVSQEPELVARAQEALATLQSTLQTDVAAQLAVTLTFSDDDGD